MFPGLIYFLKLQADQLGHAFYMFKDESNTIKVLYKRKHSGYGLLEPQ